MATVDPTPGLTRPDSTGPDRTRVGTERLEFVGTEWVLTTKSVRSAELRVGAQRTMRARLHVSTNSSSWSRRRRIRANKILDPVERGFPIALHLS